MNRYLVILGVWFLVVWGCDPCDECGEPLVYDPTVKVVFINQDSINQLNVIVNDNKSTITELKARITELKTGIDSLDDNLDALQDSIEAGKTQYQSLFDRYKFSQDSLIKIRSVVSKSNSELDSINKVLNTTISSMNNGNVQLTKVVLLNTGTELFYEDSMSRFSLPLLLGTVGEYTESNYEITIVDTVFNLDFSYVTYESIDEARVARVRARELTVLNNDTVNVDNCNNECISDETTVTVYF